MPSSTFLILHHYFSGNANSTPFVVCQLKQAETPKKWGSVHNHRPVNKSRCTMWLHAVFRAYIRNRCPQWSLSERRTPVLPKRFAATSVSPKLTELIRVIPQHTEPQRNEHIVISLATLRVWYLRGSIANCITSNYKDDVSYCRWLLSWAACREYIRHSCPQWSLSVRRTPVLPKRFAATSVLRQ